MLKPGTRNADLLAKMAQLPPGYTHVGVANVDTLGLTVVASAEGRDPVVFDPTKRTWQPMLTRTKGGLLQ